ncbi:hypothetical protein AB4251_18130 [Vibrio lentus]|uniref:Uncharacterized protein n=1 Tax=Vibrio lentus TaxID=136468 RepID=A0AB36XJ50_9VIBR|nr:hypothetical protein [Vibrio lentus]MCC4838254.1 hypothetical protein [Vibrio lentus]PMI12053.1 hypothetical protein BCU51_25620 [Vibrio lentus]PMK36343.1 hypothetical protein BCU02_12070 [Vibrio lentus]PMK44360.1 hypothetical protein BCT99_24805 [Vibrio lentus]PML32984.1 hypothetical protein BCT79_14990 [Vibrio lentus]
MTAPIPIGFYELFDNYIHQVQALEHQVCPTIQTLIMHLKAMEYFRRILNERLYTKASGELLRVLYDTGIDYRGCRFWLTDTRQLRVNRVPVVVEI